MSFRQKSGGSRKAAGGRASAAPSHSAPEQGSPKADWNRVQVQLIYGALRKKNIPIDHLISFLDQFTKTEGKMDKIFWEEGTVGLSMDFVKMLQTAARASQMDSYSTFRKNLWQMVDDAIIVCNKHTREQKFQEVLSKLKNLKSALDTVESVR